MSSLQGGEGFAAIRELLDSEVDYQRLDAFDLDELEETFDFILCFGILHRVENPLGLLKIIRRRLAAGGRVLLETHGAADRTLDSAAVHVPAPGEVYARDDFVYWGFTPAGLDAMARHAGFEGFELIDTPVIDGHPRVLGALRPARSTDRGPQGGRFIHASKTSVFQGLNNSGARFRGPIRVDRRWPRHCPRYTRTGSAATTVRIPRRPPFATP